MHLTIYIWGHICLYKYIYACSNKEKGGDEFEGK